jgi:DNA topoisomerase-1
MDKKINNKIKKNNNILVIVESPAKCSKIESYLGNDYKCIASYGHLRKLSNLNQIDLNNNFETEYSIIDEPLKIKQIEKIKKEIANCKEVILATDDDREGESIAWHICMLFDLNIKTTKRIIFHEITSKAIKDAILNPRFLNIDIINAQKTRQIVDLLVGFTISPILWNCFVKNNKNSLSAGRCQSVALRIIYDNYNEIKNNTCLFYYNTIGYFTNKNIPFELSCAFEKEEDLINFYNNSLEFQHVFNISEIKQSHTNPPLPLITSTLQQLASNELHISPKVTMKYAQQLYENGLITYMRTDNKNYSSEFLKDMSTFILKEYNNDKYIGSMINSNSNISENNIIDKSNVGEAHEAIRPVNINIKFDKIDSNLKIEEKAKKLYHLIWKRTIESCMSNSISNYVNAEITAYNSLYKYKSEQIVFLGWKIVDNKQDKDKDIVNPIYSYLLGLKKGIILDYKTIISKISIKNQILHYTEAKLVQILEEMGIGRPSTFSSLVDKIQERKYVVKENIKGKIIKCKEFILEGEELTETIVEKEFGNEKNKLVIQPLGITVIEFLIKNFDLLFNYEYTKNMELELDIISKGGKLYVDTCEKCYKELTNSVKDLDLNNNHKKFEIKIDENNSYIIGKNGPVIKQIENNKTVFKSVKKEIDINKLKNGEYKLEDLLESDVDKNKNINELGCYQGKPLYLKKGKYGLYIEWGTNKRSMKEFGNRPIENITYVDIIKILEKDNLLDHNKPIGLLRELTKDLSIRSGKYGDYIMFKSTKMLKPAFYKLNEFKGDYLNCEKNIINEWITKTYHIDI